ncbi:hypothetical protein ACA910_015059 [Epithemia clementina (nom. ined.)]
MWFVFFSVTRPSSAASPRVFSATTRATTIIAWAPSLFDTASKRRRRKRTTEETISYFTWRGGLQHSSLENNNQFRTYNHLYFCHHSNRQPQSRACLSSSATTSQSTSFDEQDKVENGDRDNALESFASSSTNQKAIIQTAPGAVDDDDIAELTRTWRDTPCLNPILRLPCWRVPKQSREAIQTILESPLTQSYLSSRMPLSDIVSGRHKVRVIQDDREDNRYKLILLHPSVPYIKELPDNVQELLQSYNILEHTSSGDRIWFTKQLRPGDFTASFILEQLLPPHLHPPPSSFETIGHVAHLNLKDLHVPYRYLIGQVLLEVLPNLNTVIQKVGEVSGPYRTYPYEIVAKRDEKDKKGSGSTVVSFSEWGIGLHFDVQNVYWSSRLAQERRRLVKHEFQSGQWIADAFCGVGALCLQAALHKKCIITANDWNPAAIHALKEHVQCNKLAHSFHQITCGDAYEFLASLGLSNHHQQAQIRLRQQQQHLQTNKDKNVQQQLPPKLPSSLPHHVVLNYPLEAASFLGALRWWRSSRSGRFKKKRDSQVQPPPEVIPRVHVYIFAKDRSSSSSNNGTISTATTEIDATSNKNNNERIMEEMAVKEVASHLLPVLPGQESASSSTDLISTATKMTRWDELNQNFGCNVKVHNVRDVAPGKIVFCVSFSATDRLLRYMQGDYTEDS